MPPQRDDRAPRGRLCQLAPWMFLGLMAMAMIALNLVFTYTSGLVDAPNTANFLVYQGKLGQETPREIALSRSAALAAKELTSGALPNVPWLSSSSAVEKAAIEAMEKIGIAELTGTLFLKMAEDNDQGKRRPSSTALATRMTVDDSACPSKSKTAVINRGDDSCAGVYGACYKSCNGGFWSRPVPGACHLVCVVLDDKCERCATRRNGKYSRKKRRKAKSRVSALDTVDQMGNADTPKPSFAMSRAPWILLMSLWFGQAVGCACCLWRLAVSISEIERRISDMMRVQEEQAALIAANDERDDGRVRDEINDNVDQPAAEESPANGGLLAAGYNFATGWTIDRARELGIVP